MIASLNQSKYLEGLPAVFLLDMKRFALQSLMKSPIFGVRCAGDLLILCGVGWELHVFHGERCDQEHHHLPASPVP